MSMYTEIKTIDELKAEADVLGIVYNKNIGADKLAAKIEAHYESQSAGDLVQEKADDEVEVTEPVSVTPTLQGTQGKPGAVKSKEQMIREMAMKAKTEAFKKRIVTISSNDKRESEWTTTAYLSCENQFFGISRIVPLDIPIELEVCLIDIAKTTEVTLHKDEIVNGRRTGNKVPVRTRKFNVSYEEIQPA